MNEDELFEEKYWYELTPEEQMRCWKKRWVKAKPGEGSPESTVKYLPVDAMDIVITFRTLESIRVALAHKAETHNIRYEWPYMEASYLHRLLQMRTLSEEGKI